MSGEFVLPEHEFIRASATVNLKVNDATLVAEGFATRHVITETRRVVRFIPGLNQFKKTTARP